MTGSYAVNGMVGGQVPYYPRYGAELEAAVSRGHPVAPASVAPVIQTNPRSHLSRRNWRVPIVNPPQDPDGTEAAHAAWLSRLGFETGQDGKVSVVGVPALSETLLQDKEARVRWEAATALGEIGPLVGAVGLDSLRKALQQDGHSVVRGKAAMALGQLGRTAGDVGAVALARASFRDSDAEVRWRAAHALKQLGPTVGGAGAAALTKALVDSKIPSGRERAAIALAIVGPLAGEAGATALDAALEKEEGAVPSRKQVDEWLAKPQVVEPPGPAFDALAKELRIDALDLEQLAEYAEVVELPRQPCWQQQIEQLNACNANDAGIPTFLENELRKRQTRDDELLYALQLHHADDVARCRKRDDELLHALQVEAEPPRWLQHRVRDEGMLQQVLHTPPLSHLQQALPAQFPAAVAQSRAQDDALLVSLLDGQTSAGSQKHLQSPHQEQIPWQVQRAANSPLHPMCGLSVATPEEQAVKDVQIIDFLLRP